MIGAIVGDFFFRQGDPGIGRLIDNYRAELASEQLFAAIAASSLLGIARVRARRLGRRARRRPLARERPTTAMTEGHREARVMTGGVS